MAVGRKDGLPHFVNSPPLSKRDLDVARINNQFVVNGNAPSFPLGLTLSDKRKVVFLEYYFATAIGNISDGDNVAILSSIPANVHYDFAISPIRLDGGVRFSANGVIAKGFFIEVSYEMS